MSLIMKRMWMPLSCARYGHRAKLLGPRPTGQTRNCPSHCWCCNPCSSQFFFLQRQPAPARRRRASIRRRTAGGSGKAPQPDKAKRRPGMRPAGQMKRRRRVRQGAAEDTPPPPQERWERRPVKALGSHGGAAHRRKVKRRWARCTFGKTQWGEGKVHFWARRKVALSTAPGRDSTRGADPPGKGRCWASCRNAR